VVPTFEFEFGKHIPDDLMGLHFKIRTTFALKWTKARLSEPFLKTVHTKGVFALIALKRAHENTMADSTLEFFRECLLVDHSLCFNRVLHRDCVHLWLFSRFSHRRVCGIFRDKRKVYSWVVVNVYQRICCDTWLLALSTCCDWREWVVCKRMGYH